jgi:hypothetical protein
VIRRTCISLFRNFARHGPAPTSDQFRIQQLYAVVRAEMLLLTFLLMDYLCISRISVGSFVAYATDRFNWIRVK